MKPTRAILVLTALTGLVSGCMVGPDYQAPAAPATPVSSQSYTAEPLLLSSEQRVHMGVGRAVHPAVLMDGEDALGTASGTAEGPLNSIP